MPMYSWEDSVSGKRVDIIRPFERSDESPVRDDISEKEMSDVEIVAAQWKKILNSPGFVRMAGWGYGRKGHW